MTENIIMRFAFAFQSIVALTFFSNQATFAQPSPDKQLNDLTHEQKSLVLSTTTDQKHESFQPSIHAEKDQIIVTVEGVGDSRSSALNQAWLEAIRLAVGMMIEAKTELDQDKVAEKIIAHSRGVVEGYEILGADQEGGVFHLRMQAKVRKDILRDGLQYVASKGQVIAFSLDDLKPQEDLSLNGLEEQDAKSTTEEKNAQDAADLFVETAKKYRPEDFLALQAVSKLKVVEGKSDMFEMDFEVSFNEEKYYKEYIPDLERVLDQISHNKTKKYFREQSEIDSIRAIKKDGRVLKERKSFYNGINKTGKGFLFPEKTNTFAYYLYELPSTIGEKLKLKPIDQPGEKDFSFLIKFYDEFNNDIFEQNVEVPISVGQICVQDNMAALKDLLGPAIVTSIFSAPKDISGPQNDWFHLPLSSGEKIYFTGVKQVISSPQGQQTYFKAQYANALNFFWIREDFFSTRIQNGSKWLNELDLCSPYIFTPTIIVAINHPIREFSKYKFIASFSIPNEILGKIKTIKINPLQ